MTLRMILLAGAATLLPQVAVAMPASGDKVEQTGANKTASADLAKLVADFQIPYQTFTLANGLKVIVMTDRTAPIVYTSITYDVGSTYEPAGKSGFAHLFEHLLFNGSENVPGDYFTHLRDAGLISINGGTSFDYTNYYETVPVGSLDRVLYMESDRMGHLLGAVTQAVLDEQRGVVQNEKRNGDNNPGSIANYSSRAAIYPSDHPYGHLIIGSMKDLNAASLADVHQWFKDYYGPNNATMILAGDIDLATARAKVEKYFGGIPRGRETAYPVSPVPVLNAPVVQTLTAPVSQTSITRIWAVPGVNGADADALDAAAALMTGVDGAPLSEKLVRQDKLFTSVYANNRNMRGVGEFSVSGSVRDGVDPKEAERALDAAIADFLRSAPSDQALQRFKSIKIIPIVQNAERMEARAGMLLNAATLLGSPGAYKRDLQAYLKLTPADVMAAARKWLTRPNYRMVLKPGPRMTPPGDDNAAPAVAAAAAPVAPGPVVKPQAASRGPLPVIGEPGSVRFPDIQRATLKNGIPVTYVQSKTVPFTRLIMTMPFGSIDDPADKPNLVEWMVGMLGEGAAGHDDHWFRQQRELTGIQIGAGVDDDSATVYIAGPTPSFDQALDMGMMTLTRPDFPIDRLEERRRQALARLKATPTAADTLVWTMFARELAPGSASAKLADISSAAEINGITRADLQAAFDRWVRPQGAKLYVASNEPLSTLLPKLNMTVGQWAATGKGSAGTIVPRVQATTAGPPGIVLIDMPDAVQATIVGGQLLAIPYRDEAMAANVANITLGGGFLSRINMNLREDKHWSYGASGSFENKELRSSYRVSTEVQPDKVGAAIAEVRKEVNEIRTTRPITQAEFDQGKANLLRKRVANYRTGSEVLSGAKALGEKGWPDDFYTTYDDRLNALTLAQANAELKKQLDPSKWVWVVAGNAKVIRPQLEGLGLPVEVMTPAQVIAGK
ncbi:M16 family metallopeptidase [Sphingomonas sp. CLY1604]|uniref:M16 family metallopeptidase n=1 Tax=Sphingomonas sp. CLY1604 TaxID=3457786 RepID=UPI003FD80DBE